MFSDITDDFVGDDLEDVEVDGFSEGPALADNDNVTFLDCKCGGAVHWDISVSLLVSVVFGDVVEIVSSDDDGSLHFCGNTNTLEDLASDGDVGGEGALLVDVSGFDGLLGGFESKTDILEVSDA